MTNKEKFKEVYRAALTECVQLYPEQYAFPAEDAPKIAERMFVAIDTKSYDKAGKAFAKTIKVLGISNTYKAINAFWAS